LSRFWSATIDGVWIGEWVYWRLTHVSLQVIRALLVISTIHKTLEHKLSLLSLLSPVVFRFCAYAVARWRILLNWTKTNKLRGLSPQAQTIPTERPPLVGEVSANFIGYKASRGQCNESPTVVNFGFLCCFLVKLHRITEVKADKKEITSDHH
jgi:hypothetical protein